MKKWRDVNLVGLTEKIVSMCAVSIGRAGAASRVGHELKRLRIISGLSQAQVAEAMNEECAVISKIEDGGEIYLSTIERYVTALGASLRLNAHFSADAPITARLHDKHFYYEKSGNSQLVFSLMEEEKFEKHRDVVLSIKPIYSEKILSGRKTVELRRRFPVEVPNGIVAYIYSSAPVKAIVGTVLIRGVVKLPVEKIWDEFKHLAFIERHMFDKYFEGVDQGYALFFGDVKSFTRPLPLSELRERFGFEPPQSFLYAKHDLRKALQDEPAIVSY